MVEAEVVVEAEAAGAAVVVGAVAQVVAAEAEVVAAREFSGILGRRRHGQRRRGPRRSSE